MGNELFDQMKQEVTDYGKSLTEVGKLRLVGIASRVLGLFLLIFTLVLCIFAFFTFGAVAAIDAMSAHMPVWAAALTMGSLYIVLIVIAIVCRKPLFVHQFISLMTKQVKTEQELAMKTMEAEHKAKLQRIQMECQVKDATRELNSIIRFVRHIWNLIFGKRNK